MLSTFAGDVGTDGKPFEAIFSSSRGRIDHSALSHDALITRASSRIKSDRDRSRNTIKNPKKTASLTALVVLFFSSHPSQAPKDGTRLKTDPASLFKNCVTWTATTAAVSNTPLVGKTVRKSFLRDNRHLVGHEPKAIRGQLLFLFPSSPLPSRLPLLSNLQRNKNQGRKCIERVFGTLLGSVFGLFGVFFHNAWAAIVLAFSAGLCGELLVSQAGFDCAGKLVATSFISVAFPSYWRLGFPRQYGELRVALVDAFARTVAAVIGVLLVAILSIVWFPRSGSDKAAASTADLVSGLKKVAESAFAPLVGGARPRPAPFPDSDEETDGDDSDEEGVRDESQEDDVGTTASVVGGSTKSATGSSASTPRKRKQRPSGSSGRGGFLFNKSGHRQLPTAGDLLPAFSAPKPPGSRPRARERHRDEVTEALFQCSAARDKIRDSLAAAKNELVVARVPSIPVVARSATRACVGGNAAKDETSGDVVAISNPKSNSNLSAVDVEAAASAVVPAAKDARDPAAKGVKPTIPSQKSDHHHGGKRALSRHPVYLPLFLTKKRSAIAFLHHFLPSWLHSSPSLHPRAVSDAANAAMAAARALWLAGDAAAGGFPPHIVEIMRARYPRANSPHGASLYDLGEASWVMDVARKLVLDALEEAERAARAAAGAYRHGGLSDSVIGRASSALNSPPPPPPTWPALRRLQEELLWMRDARMIHEAETRMTLDAVQLRAERQAQEQQRKRATLSKLRSEASASAAAAALAAAARTGSGKLFGAGEDASVSMIEEGGSVSGSSVPRASVAAHSAAKARWMALLFALGDVRDALEALAAALEAWLAATGAPRRRAEEAAKAIEWHGHSTSFGKAHETISE